MAGSFSADSLAAMLMCCRMSATRQELFEPMDASEFRLFAKALERRGLTPGWLLNRNIPELKDALDITEQEAHRIHVLAERMITLTYEMDDYFNYGITILTCYDRDYPSILEHHLGQQAPPVLYVAGNVSLFRRPMISYAGSNPGDDVLFSETKTLVSEAAKYGFTVVTGGTSGLDYAVECQTLLDENASIIAWPPGGMIEAVQREGLRDLLAEGRAAIVGVSHPHCAVTSQQAHIRSRYFYASGTVSYMPACVYKRGDAWDGAIEALRGKYTDRMYVRKYDICSGNAMLQKRGAVSIDSVNEISFERVRQKWSQDEGKQLSVFDL